MVEDKLPEYVENAKHSDPDRYVHCCGKDILRDWIGWHIKTNHKNK